MDYREFQSLKVHANWEAYLSSCQPKNIYALSTKGTACYSSVNFEPGDALLFGPETRGLPEDIRNGVGSGNVLRLPMHRDSRSLNLSNTVSIVTYEAWRQLGFSGGS